MKNSNFYQKTDISSDKWYTPPDLVAKLGHFDLDPCSPNNLPWKLADKFYSLENGEDGLALPWTGRVWLNSPYSNWVPFTEKLKKHGNGISLMFCRCETKGWFNHIWNDADSILFIKGRIKFIRSNFKEAATATQPSALIAYGKNNTEALEKCSIEGKLVKLK